MIRKRELEILVACFMAIVLSIASLATSLFVLHELKKDAKSEFKKEQTNVETLGIDITELNEDGIHLFVSPVLKAGEPGVLNLGSAFEKRLTATVLPFDAPNKLVDWTVAWQEDATRSTQNVSEYIIVTPDSDGSNLATVKCLKSFEGDYIIVTVTTRVGGYSATCLVEFLGIPQSLDIDMMGNVLKVDYAWNKTMLELDCGETYNFAIGLDNDIHAVGSTYGNYSLSMEVFGSINVDASYTSHTTGEVTYSSETVDYQVADLFENYGYLYTFMHTARGMVVGMHVSINENGQLVIEARNGMSSYYYYSNERGGVIEKTFNSYVDGKIPYATITVTETTSGLSQSINVKLISTVDQVELSDSTLTF